MELQGQKLAESSVQNGLLVTFFFSGSPVRRWDMRALLQGGKFFCADFAKGLNVYNVWCTSMEAMPLWIDTCDRRSYKRMQKTELSTQRVQQEKGCDTLTQVITNSSNLSRKPFIMDLEQAGMTIIIWVERPCALGLLGFEDFVKACK